MRNNRLSNFTESLFQRITLGGMEHKIAIRTPTDHITYRELFMRVCQASDLFKSLQVEPGDRLPLIMNDSISLVIAFLAAIRIGAIPIILNTLMANREYPFFFEDSRAKVCIIEEALIGKIDNLPGIRPITMCDQKESSYSYHKCLEARRAAENFHQSSSEEIAFWQYTSGSTGAPKAIQHTHHAPTVIFDNYAQDVLGIGKEDVVFSTSRMFFGYGLGNSLIFPLQAGATTILFPGPMKVENIKSVIRECRPTLFFSVPSVYKELMESENGLDDVMTGSIRLAISAGESLPEKLYHRWKNRTGIELLDGLGSTEALHIFISSRPGKVKPGSCGKPLSEVSIKVLGEDGRPTPAQTPGVLWIRSQSVSPGYWNRNELNATTFKDGWLNTHDIVSVDEDNHVWHKGRSDDMFKVKGMWVSPVEIENEIHAMSIVDDCAVVGLAGPMGLLRPVAFVAFGRDQQEDVVKASLKAHLEAVLPPYKVPIRIEVVDGIPRTVTGKKKRYELMQRQNGGV